MSSESRESRSSRSRRKANESPPRTASSRNSAELQGPPEQMERIAPAPMHAAVPAPIAFDAIHLPHRQHVVSSLLSLSSTVFSGAGMLMGNFDSAGTKTTRAILGSLGFFSKQIHDGYENHVKRQSIRNKKITLDDITVRQSDRHCPPPREWYNDYGLTVDWKVFLTTIVNVILQLAVIAFSSYDAYKSGEDKFLNANQFKILLTACTLSAIFLDHIEQQFKNDNLRRREEQLTQGISRPPPSN